MAARDAYGLLAEFEQPDALVAAAKRARAAGYRDLDAFTPFPVYELAPVLRLDDYRVRWIGMIGGATGFVVALAMQSIPITTTRSMSGAGRSIRSPASIVAFELTVLFAALSAAFGMLAFNGLPRLNHPVFAAPHFYRASRDRFFLCVLGHR